MSPAARAHRAPVAGSTVATLPSAGVGPAEFKAAFRNHPAGVAIITATGPEGPVGLTVSSVISVSAEPPLLVFSLSAGSRTTPLIAGADTVVVHLLGAAQAPLAKAFATPGVDRFAATDWHLLPTGEPVLSQAPVWLRGRIVNAMDAGGSVVVAVHLLQANVPADGDLPETPLVYHNRSWHRLGDHSVID
ncbi:flavin reductase family protein [Paeniglutamicibacter sp. MACA_103]|uniref:flavin reductase family protein n=1 Tax=Paeniglutamicibacter sp. MACA_103 TaxID=3377337 RepID=UPI003892D133